MTITELCKVSHRQAKEKGFWDLFENGSVKPRNNAELLMLITTEIAECCEALRHGNKNSDHIPKFSFAEEELADAVIRIADMCEANGYRLEEAIEEKLKFNTTREMKHGKQF